MPYINGIADELLDGARERLAKQKGTETDQLLLVLEALTRRSQDELQRVAKELKERDEIDILGKKVSIQQLMLPVIAGEAAGILALAIPLAF